MTGFGHRAAHICGAFIDTWGAGPYTIRIGKRRYYFTDSDMFGPLLESKNGKVLDKQPISERHPFWIAYGMWRKTGRMGKKRGAWIVCRWRMPRAGQLWKDSKGISHIICDPENEILGYNIVSRPNSCLQKDAKP